MKQYKISVMRFGNVVVEAESKEEAAAAAGQLPEHQIHWFSREEGLEGPYVITLVEELAQSENYIGGKKE